MRKHHRITALLTAVAITLTLPAALGFPLSPAVSAKNAKNSYDFTGLSITREQIRLKTKGSYTLTTRQIGLSDSSVQWSSADPSIASVDSEGRVVAHRIGKTAVFAVKDGYTASCAVLVGEEDPAALEYEHTLELAREFLDLRFGMFLHFNSATYEFAAKGGRELPIILPPVPVESHGARLPRLGKSCQIGRNALRRPHHQASRRLQPLGLCLHRL